MIDSVSLSAALRAPSLDMVGKGGAAAPSASAATGGADFGQVLANVAGEAVNNMKAGEAAAISGMRGQASVQDVVDAVMSAERSLQTALAVRDKAVSAWQEISRMQI
jgi:flagellar hook-basal body complex protein FliE